MKLASKLAALKQRKQQQQTERRAGHDQGGKPGRWRWTVLALGLFVVGGGTFVVLKFFIWNQLPAELVGKWVVQQGPLAGGTFEFFPNGTLETRIKSEGEQFALKARVTVEDKILRTTTQDPQTRREQTRKSIIRELSANALVLELEDGQMLQMVRAR
jgi:hypothetical protein